MMKNNDLSRIPQSLSFNPDALIKVFGKEADIIRDLLVLTSSEYSRDLFGQTTLTVDDFVRLGHCRTDLQRVLPQFKFSKSELDALIKERRDQIGDDELFVELVHANDTENNKRIPFLHDHPCITKLDYALYRACTEVLRISRKSGDNMESIDIKLFDSIKISNVSKVERRRYDIRLSGRWINNLFNEYNLIDIKDYVSISGAKIDVLSSYRNFYIYLGRIIASIQWQIHEGTGDSYILSVDEVCRILGITISTPKNKKARVKEALDTIQAKISKTFKWEFDKNGTKYNYWIKFTFDKDNLSYFDEKLNAVVNDLYNKKAKAVWIGLRKNGGSIANNFERNKGQSLFDPDDFYSWLNSSEDLILRERIYAEVHNQVYHNQNYPRDSVKSKQKRYIQLETLQQIAESSKTDDIDKIAKSYGYKKDDKGYYKLV